MKTPRRLAGLVEEGPVDAAIGQSTRGREATVDLVRCGGKTSCAEVYKGRPGAPYEI